MHWLKQCEREVCKVPADSHMPALLPGGLIFCGVQLLLRYPCDLCLRIVHLQSQDALFGILRCHAAFPNEASREYPAGFLHMLSRAIKIRPSHSAYP